MPDIRTTVWLIAAAALTAWALGDIWLHWQPPVGCRYTVANPQASAVDRREALICTP